MGRGKVGGPRLNEKCRPVGKREGGKEMGAGGIGLK
jgi:hypothetical protein